MIIKFDYILVAFLVMCSIFYLPGQNFMDSQLGIFKAGIPLMLAIALCIRPKRYLCNIWMNLFLFLSVLLFIFLKETPKMVGITSIVNVVLLSILFFIVLNWLENRKLIYNTIAIIILINLFIVIMQYFKIDPICLTDNREPNYHLVGLFGFKQNLGAYMAMSIPLMILVSPIMVFISIILTGAPLVFGAILSGIAGIGSFLFTSNNYIKKIRNIVTTFILTMIVSISCLVYFTSTPSEKQILKEKIEIRYLVWRPFLEVFMRGPWTGYGYGSVKYIAKQLKEIPDGINSPRDFGQIEDLFNDYLEKGIELGIGAIIIMVGLIGSCVRKFNSIQNKDLEICALFASLVTIAVGMLTHTYMHVNIGVMSIYILAMFLIKVDELKKEDA